MKIIICGAGIAGLSTYLQLTKHLPQQSSPNPPHEILIFESHRPRTPQTDPSQPSATTSLAELSASTALIGGALGLSPNGMRVLRHLSAPLHDAVRAQGFPCESYVFEAARGWRLGKVSAGDAREDEAPEVCVATSRQGLWRCLMDVVPERVVRYREVRRVERRGGRVVVWTVEGGEEEEKAEEADLVIGADGVRSRVKVGIFGEERAEEEGIAARYTGLAGIGGFIPISVPEKILEQKAMVFTFGPNGFFGYSQFSPSKTELMWWSTFQTASTPDRKAIDFEEVRTQMQKRHSTWADPLVHEITSKAKVESIYPTWEVPNLPTWGERGMVLVGDAAHGLSPTSGQGASQALEDGETLALLLRKTLSSESLAKEEKGAIDLSIKLYYEIRHPRVEAIRAQAKFSDRGKTEMGWFGEMSMYAMLWLIMTFPSIGKALMGDVNKALYGWIAETEVDKALERYRVASLAR